MLGTTGDWASIAKICIVAVHTCVSRPSFLLQPSGPAKKAELGDAAPKESVPQQPKGPHAPWWTGVMDRRFVGTFEPLAVWLKAQTSAGGMQFGPASCYA